MTKKIKFTAKRLSSFSCPADKQQSFLWDKSTPGLGLRTTPRESHPAFSKASIGGKLYALLLAAHWLGRFLRSRLRPESTNGKLMKVKTQDAKL
jgi:hypothetical protein